MDPQPGSSPALAPARHRRPLLALAVVAATAVASVGLAPLTATAAVAPGAGVLINEVYGGGGNNSAAFDRDFIELYNSGTTAVDLGSWSVQYASASGTNYQVTPLTGQTIQPGDHLLIGQAFGANLDLPDIAVDVDGGIAMSGTSGKVALVSNQSALAAGADVAGLEQVRDFVGWGAANAWAGTAAAPGTTNPTSISRNGDHLNTADNAADFALGAPTPTGASGGTVEPEPEPEPEPTDPAVVAIDEIQGSGAASPLSGQTVTTTGVVTAHYPTGGFSGYVIQTPGTGGALDLAAHTASDAVFVYATGGAVSEVALGDTVEVTGAVGEFNGLTQISVGPGGARQVAAAEPPLPATVAWPATAAEREVLESMLVAPQGDYTVSNTYATNQYGEVALAFGTTPLRQPTDVARPDSAEAAAVVADNAARAVVLDDASTTDFLRNPTLTPAYVSLTEPIIVGAGVAFTDPVIVDFRNNAWKFNPTTPLTADGSGTDGVAFENTRTAAPAAVGGDLTIASFNVLNYFTTLGTESASCVPYNDRFGNGVTVNTGCDQRGAWDAEDFQRQQDKIVAAIDALDADVVGLMEIENSAALGEETDEATATLVDALNAAAGETRWAFVASSEELPAASEQDVITNAIIYQPEAATPVGASRALGTLSGSGDVFSNAREPIAQVFEPADGGEEVLFVVNHFKSKGSVTFPQDADQGDGQGAANWSRVRQATALRDWVAEIQGDVDAVALAGDFNSYGQEDPLQVLYAAGYVNAEQELGVETSSYSFQGLSGSLDHILLNEGALDRATGADIWNINAGEALATEYSRFRYHGTEFYAPDAYRSSDHDPVLVGLAAATPPIELTLLGINDFHGRIDADTVNFAGTIEQLRADADGPAVFLSSGDNIGASLFASAIAKDQPTIDVLNALGLQATAVGNHEFDRGFADLAGRVTDESDFPQLGANVYLAGTTTPALPEYEIVDADGIAVALIGAVTEETPSLVSPSGITELEFGDPVEAVNRVAAALTDGDASNGEADVIVALYHEGAGAGTPDGATLEEEIDGGGAFAAIVEETSAAVDAIFTGHTHKQYAWSAEVPGTDRTRPVVQTGSYGQFIGEVTLTIDPETLEVTAHRERNVARTTTPAADLIAAYPRVAEVGAIVKAARAAAAEIGNTAVGEVSDDITTAFSGGSYVDGVYTGGTRDNRAAESTLGNTVAEMLRTTLADLPNGADIGVTNSGGLRSELWDTQAEFGTAAVPGLADGTISYSQVLAVLPFNNTLGLVTLTGAQFTEVLEQQWQTNADGTVPSRPYLQLGLSDNVTYTYDETRPAGSRITSVSIDGKPIDAAGSYRIGTLSFLASGGDNFRAFQKGTGYVDTGLMDYEAFIDYIADESPLSAPYAKHAVKVTGVPESAAPGEAVSFSVAGLDLTSRGAPANTSLTVTVDGEPAGEALVANGAATVTFAVPEGADAGEASVELTVLPSGTVVRVPLTVEEAAPDTVKPLTKLVSPTTAGPFQRLSITVDATDDRGLRRIVANIYQDGKLVRSTQTAANGATSARHTATVSLPDGAYTIRYNSADLAGNVSATRTIDVTIDTKAPTVTVKAGEEFTVGADGAYDKVSFKLYDAGKIDRLTVNGVAKNLTDNAWSDLNFVRPGVFGAVAGANTLVVYDVAGNATTIPFTLR